METTHDPRPTTHVGFLCLALITLGAGASTVSAIEFQYPVQLNNWSTYEDTIDDPILPESNVSSSQAALLASTFDITIVPGPTLSGNQAAVDAFNRAAMQWERYIKDPITVTVNADLASLGAGILGSTSNVMLQSGFDTIANNIRSDAVSEPGDSIVASLPGASTFTALIPSGFGISGNIRSAKSLLKAVGFTGLDSQFGASDGSIIFSTNILFDFDNSDGISLGAIDFETVAAHEIGHLLGFTSSVDMVDNALNNGQTITILTNPFDLFRFRDELASSDPATPLEFASNARDLSPGQVSIFDDTDSEVLVSTGLTQGDGRQASHWKANELTGTLIGLMDPTLGFGEKATATLKDLRALDLLGWDIELLAGDLTGDGFVGIDDLNIVLLKWNQSVTPGALIEGDPSEDGFVGVDDLNIVLVNWNNRTPPSNLSVPEPGTAGIAGLAILWAVTNRRRMGHRRTNGLTASEIPGA